MNSFEYAAPTAIADALALLGKQWGETEILAGGTDLVARMKDCVTTPQRLVNIKKLPVSHAVESDADGGVRIGALMTLSELAGDPAINSRYPILATALGDAASPQIRNRASLGGNLCQRPRCWYFRNGYGLLGLDAAGKPLVPNGCNQYHAIFGNDGPAYFVSPSSIAPTLIAYGAVVRVIGDGGAVREVALQDFYRIPQSPTEREHDLKPNEMVVEVRIPPADGWKAAYYEVRQKHAFDWPLVTASIALRVDGGVIRKARVILGHVAPVPWRCAGAEAFLLANPISATMPAAAAAKAVEGAKSLGQNGYKISLAGVSVERALAQLLAPG